ncbi:MAG: hypothetical protein QUS09_07220, partial [Methanotrichaceae archaeon]|nr:hypothetical protein [Methanotrichaceae archaeon]
MRLAFISFIALLILPVAQASAADLDDLSISAVSEQCGDWKVSFNWSIMDEYKKSTSHGDSEANGVEVTTDTLILTSAADPKRTVKIAIMKYSSRDSELVNTSILMVRADEALLKSKICKKLSATARMIDGRPAAFVSGARCSDGEPVYVAVYPVSYFFDRSGRSLESDALGVI